MTRRLNLYVGVLCLGLITTCAGCQSSSDADQHESEHGHGHSHDHDHSHRPKTLRAAIESLQEMRDEIRTAIEQDNAEAAHGPLHEVGQLLKAMPGLAADTDLAEADWDELKGHVDSLFDAFGDVDKVFHKQDGDKQQAYDDSKLAIDEGVAAIAAYLTKLPADKAKAKHDHDHDHDGHDHDDHGHEHDEAAHDHEDDDHSDHDHGDGDHDEHDHAGHDEDDHDHDEEDHADDEEPAKPTDAKLAE